MTNVFGLVGLFQAFGPQCVSRPTELLYFRSLLFIQHDLTVIEELDEMFVAAVAYVSSLDVFVGTVVICTIL